MSGVTLTSPSSGSYAGLDGSGGGWWHFYFYSQGGDDAVEPGGHPPVAPAQDLHDGWYEDHADQGGVDEYGHGEAEADCRSVHSHHM
jgi:hypothetical protein